jgi:hypothetical protein
VTASHDSRAATAPIERFRPTSGRLVGSLSLVVVAGLLVHPAVDVRTPAGQRVAAGLAFVAVLVWMTQLRPRATLYADVLHLRNVVRDVTVPLVAVDEVAVHRTLEVRVGEVRYVCVGIGKPLRAVLRPGSGRGPSTLLGWDRLTAYTEEATPPRPDESALSYQEYVETRIGDLVADARNRAGAGTTGVPRSSWAWPEVVALVVTGGLFVATLLS